jgi:hypothetical protein
MGQFWAGCCGGQTVGSTPDEKSFYGIAKRPDGRTMVPLSRPKRKFQFRLTENDRLPMSSSSTIDANSAGQTVLGRLSSGLLRSPAVTVALLIACVFWLRLPSALVPRELSMDESQMLSQAMKFLVDPRPWIAVDPTTSGPLNSYLISVFLLMGFKPGFVLVHVLASVLVCLQVLVAYLTLRRLGSEKTAALGAFLMVLLYGLATYEDYLHYASELLPTLLLTLGFYMFLVWLDEPAGRRVGAQLCLLFSGGLVLGAVPWCKLQAVPISGALGLVVLAAIFRDRGPSFSFSLRVKELIAFCAGAVLTTCVMLVILAKTGAIDDFWYSYIRANLAYARSVGHFLFMFLTPSLHQLLLVAFGVGLLVYVSRSPDILLLFKKRRWVFSGLLVYAGAALFAVCRPKFLFLHYAIFLVPPMTYLTAVPFLESPEVADPTKSRQSPHRLMFVLVLILLSASIDGVRYANMITTIRKLSHSHWLVGDSNERIAEVVRDIQKTRPVRSLAIWGWAPGVYVLTGIPPATRDSDDTNVISQGPMQKYFRERFVGDLREKTPDLFIDAVAPGAFMWLWTENNGYESDPQLQKFIEGSYILVDELTLVDGAKPVRFFARREQWHQLPTALYTSPLNGKER